MSNYTEQEIEQQFSIWKDLVKELDKQKSDWKVFFTGKENYKFIFTGAGTSEFIGKALFGYCRSLNLDAESIASTDIVSSPKKFLQNKPTILFSFGRSGNSPESVGAIKIAEKCIDKLYHIIITCNAKGNLYEFGLKGKNSKVILLNPATNDKGFAMTSSYSSMMVTAMSLIQITTNSFDVVKLQKDISASELNRKILRTKAEEFPDINLQRVVYLGSGIYQGFAQEGSLKLLELTQGIFPTFFNSPLSFRHGPKSILSMQTAVILLLSSDSYERQYDIDLLNEIISETRVLKIVVLDSLYDESLAKMPHYYSLKNEIKNEIMIGLTYIYFLQHLAVKMSLLSNINPDNPCPSGEVNRVVKGVKIYPYEQ